MGPLFTITLGLTSFVFVNAVNLYQDEFDLPAGVTAASTCGKALNASIACDTSLAQAVAGESLPAATLNTLCVSTCLTSLTSYRASVASACGTSVVIQGRDATFPITYEADNLIYGYNTTCTKDAKSGAWCSPLFNSSWPGTTGDTAIESLDPSILCTSCNIQNILLTQQSVFGYDPTFVSGVWPTIQSKCKITTSITDPGQAYVNITEPDPGPTTCLSGKTYTVKSGDTCQVIAAAQSVGTKDLISINSILPGCTNIWSGDTCGSIVNARAADMTYAQLLNWNPTIDAWCSNLIAGNNICVSAPGGYFAPTKIANGIPTGTLITTATPAPTGTAPGAPTNCGRWYVVQPGETCNTVILSQGITMSDFKAANPQINADCTNLWAATAYCVYLVTRGPTPSSYAPAPTNIATGTTKNCYRYYTAISGDTCTAITYSQVTNTTDLLRWNTGLNSQCTNLAAGSAYCVWGDAVGATTTSSATGTPAPTVTIPPRVVTDTTPCTATFCSLTLDPNWTWPAETSSGSTVLTSATPTATGVLRPSNAAAHSITSCKKWYTVVSGDYCYLICQNQGCTVANLQTWNPDLGTDCVAQLGVAYCVSA
ncbi:LysM domain protein [Ceratobasidium sp. AG-Ba]|nr:LysM domain protein [Ceratobasidium sp. AG-Ba]